MKRLLIGLLLLTFCFGVMGAGKLYRGSGTFKMYTSAQAGRSTTTAYVADFDMVPWNIGIGRFVVNASTTVSNGYGLEDSCYIYAITSLGNDFADVDTLAQDSAASLPCTLYITQANTNDSTWRSNLRISVTVTDSTGDVVISPEHKVTWDYLVRE